MTAEQREKALSKRNHPLVERYDSKAQELLPLAVGTNVVPEMSGSELESYQPDS